jgi:hypothetical protein
LDSPVIDAIRGSFHLVIDPSNIVARVGLSSLIVSGPPGMLKVIATPPKSTGTCRMAPVALF